MSQNPFEAILKTYKIVAQSIQTQLSHVFFNTRSYHQGSSPPPLFSISPSGDSADSAVVVQPKVIFSDPGSSTKGKSVVPPTKEELGRATWTLLHTIAAQGYPAVACLVHIVSGLGNFPEDHPTRQQKRDVKELMAILSRFYPCKECADHFKEILKVHPVQAGSQYEFSQWLCHVHNVVNRSLGKLMFPCQRVNARWGKLDCKDRACDLQDNSESSK